MGDTSQQAYQRFMASAYFPNGEGAPSYEQWVQQQNSTPDAGGVMANGATPYTETMTPEQVARLQDAVTLHTSDYYKNQNAASSNDPISGLYQSVLGRAPDAGGLAYWKQQLANGVPLESIKQQFQATPEAQARQGNQATTSATTSAASDPITGLYKSVLGREPDAGGKAYWQSQLNSGKSLQAIQAEMQASPEGMARRQTQTKQIANPSTQPNTNPYGVTTNNQFASSTNPYIQAAQQTALGNLAGAQTATAANRVNQSTPYANLQYTQTGVDAQGNPIWSANQTLAGPLAGAQSNLAQSVANQAAKGFNPNTPSVGINPGETYSDAIMRRLQPQMAQAKEQQDAQLANQGIVPGTQAYDNAMRTFQQGQNDQLTSAITGGFGVGLQANQQSFNQQLQQANLPITQLGAFQQATQPGYVNPYTQAATGGPDYTGAYATGNAASIAQQNAANAANASKLSGLTGLASAGIMSSGGLAGLASAFPDAYKWLKSFSSSSAPMDNSPFYQNYADTGWTNQSNITTDTLGFGPDAVGP